MAEYYCIIAALCLAVSAAPPTPPRLYQQHPGQSPHLQNISPLDYFMDHSELANYYNHQAQQKQGIGHAQPARLETLEPDSEVELIPGAQQPQQPPQQTPVSPNLPGLVPGQRVFIVHMPVPGYRPGSIGGYQPVYIVAAAPQGNPGYAANGYQNAILLNPSGQVVSPFFGYQGGPQGQGLAPGQGLVQGQGVVLAGQLPYSRPYDQVYQDPQAFAYQQVQEQPQIQPGGTEGSRGPVQLSQLLNLQSQQSQPPHPGNTPRNAAALSNPEPKRASQLASSEESKESQERGSARPAPAHALRNKA